MNSQIEKWRAQIDAVDDELLALLNQRARLAAQIGLVKKREQSPLCDPNREREVLERVSEKSDGPLTESSVRRIFTIIIDESREIQSLANKPVSQAPEPRWNRVTIVGCGLIGASFALALRRSGACRRIAGWDLVEEVRQEALRRGIIDEIDSAFADGATSKSDLVYLAIPVTGIIEFLRERGRQIMSGALVTDAGSTKVEICRAAGQYLPEGIVYVGGHPVAGSEHSGPAYSNAELFRDAPYVLIDDGDQIEHFRAFAQTLQTIGARVTLMTPEAHDRTMALVSHLPQILSSSLSATLISQPDADSILNLSGSGFRDMTRLAGSSWSIWRDVLKTNRAEIGAALGVYMQKLESVRLELHAPQARRGELVVTGQVFAAANQLLEAGRLGNHQGVTES